MLFYLGKDGIAIVFKGIRLGKGINADHGI